MKDEFAIVATCTSFQASALESAKKYSELTGKKVRAYHGGTNEIANDPDVDMIAVSIKGHLHRDAVLPALAAKKDIFVEWPAGRNLEECSEMAELAKTNGVKSLVGLQGRASPVIKRVRTWL
jgi:predicted dehydrogenase